MGNSIVRCTVCQSHGVEFGAVTAHVSLRTSTYCAACRHSHEESRWLYFCSVACLLRYVQEQPEALLAEEAKLKAAK